MERTTSRRHWLAACASTAAGLAGCLGSDDERDSSGDTDGSGPLGIGGDDTLVTPDSWPMYGVDARNTGHHPDTTGPKDDVTVRWTVEADDSFETSPAVVDGTLYAGSHDNYLYAIDVETGETEWRADLGTLVRYNPAVVDGTVYNGAHTDMYALEADSGDELWHEQLERGRWGHAVPVGSDVYVTDGYSLISFGGETGDQNQVAGLHDGASAAPAVADGLAFVGTWDQLRAIDLETGEVEWQFKNEDGERMTVSDPAVVDGTVYIGSSDHNLYAIDADTGDEKWRFEESSDTIYSSPSVTDGSVYIGSSDNYIYSVDANTGEKQWEYETGLGIRAKPAIVDDTLYIGSGDGSIYALDQETGNQIWTFKTEGIVWSGPVVLNKSVYVTSNDGNIYALEEV